MKKNIFNALLVCFLLLLTNCNEQHRPSSDKVSYQEEIPSDIFAGEWVQFLDVNGNDLQSSSVHKRIRISKSELFYTVEEEKDGVFKPFEGENGKYKIDYHLLNSISSTRIFIYDGTGKYLQEKFYDPPSNPHYFGGYYKKAN